MPSPLATKPAVDADAPIIVHSHLRWDFVWQRPQQLLSRLAVRNHVLFIEEPIHLDDVDEARLDLSQPMASLPVTIFKFAMSPYENWQQLAWAGVFLITAAVLGLNILARVLTRTRL